jgi:hypothetical protein
MAELPVGYQRLEGSVPSPMTGAIRVGPAENSRNQMLAVALAAISLGRHVTAALGVPSPTGLPYPQCYRLYLSD